MITIPTFTKINMYPDELVDELGVIKQQIDELEAVARKLKSELIKRGVGTYEGAKFFAEVQHYNRDTISPVLVRKFSDEEFIQRVTEHKEVDAVVVKPL
jgi:hypothetical protein